MPQPRRKACGRQGYVPAHRRIFTAVCCGGIRQGGKRVRGCKRRRDSHASPRYVRGMPPYVDYTSYKNNSVAESIIERYSAEDVRKELELGILQQRRTLPTSLGEGMTMTNIELVGKNIVYTVILEGVKPFDYTQQMIDEIKNNILLSGVLEENMRRILHEYGYGIIYTYINEHNEYLYDIKISSDEL